MSELKSQSMGTDRGILTDREREILTGEADVSETYGYRVVSRVRKKIGRIPRDREILAENHPGLYREFTEAACGDGNE